MSLPRAKAGPRARHCSLWREARAGWGQPLRVEAGSQVHTTTPSSCTADGHSSLSPVPSRRRGGWRPGVPGEQGGNPPNGESAEEARAAGSPVMEALILRRLREGQGGWLCPGDPKKAGVWPVAAPLHQIFLAGMSASHRHLEPEPLQALWPGLEAAGHGPVPEPFICGTALGALFFTFFWGAGM